MKKLLIAAAVLLAAPAAFAASPSGAANVNGNADAFLWKGPTDSAGLGLKGQVNINPFFVDGLLQFGEILNADSTEFRVGFGGAKELVKGVSPFAKVELVNMDIEGRGVDDTGLGLQAGLNWSVAPQLMLTAVIGLVDLGNVEGSEFSFGGAWEISKPFSLIVERRETFLDLSETRVGGRISF